MNCHIETSTVIRTHLQELFKGSCSKDLLVHISAQTLPRIISNMLLNKREDSIPLILCTLALQETSTEREQLLQLLFNLKKKPQDEERQAVLTGSIIIYKISKKSWIIIKKLNYFFIFSITIFVWDWKHIHWAGRNSDNVLGTKPAQVRRKKTPGCWMLFSISCLCPQQYSKLVNDLDVTTNVAWRQGTKCSGGCCEKSCFVGCFYGWPR